MKSITSALLIIILNVICCHAMEYERFTLYDIFPTKEQEPLLRSWLVHPGIDVWMAKTGEPVTVMVDPSVKSSLLDYLRKNRITYNVRTENIARDVEPPSHNPPVSLPQDIFSYYLSHLQIRKYLYILSQRYPYIVQVDPFCISFNRREINIIKISTKKSNKKKPIILIDAGIHAREWIAPAMALFIINQLVVNGTNRYLTEDIEWHICPLLNPDGYEYSRNKEMRWRKTRSRTPIFKCRGVDGNRNFDFHWMEINSSPDPCSPIYAGERPFSENETRALRDYVLSIKNQLKLYLTFHSYATSILYPWGYTNDTLPSNAKELHAIAESANEAQMRAGGPNYTVGTSSNVFYRTSGSSDDWVMGVANVPLAYTIEMPPGKNSGFFPAAEEIQGLVTPFFEAVRIFGEYVAEHYEDCGSIGKEQSVSSSDSKRDLLKNRNYIHTVWLSVIEFILQCNMYGA